MKNLTWILSQWHAISSSSAPIKMDGVLFQDLYSIIKVMMNRPEVQVWMKNLNDMYDHLAGYENPHNVTVDQLKTKVIDVIYQAWRAEGYQGDLDFFTKLLFLYIEIIQYEELMQGNNISSEVLIPTVLAVTKYIKAHDLSLLAHEAILTRIFGGDVLGTPPMQAYYQYIGIDKNFASYWDEASNAYLDIPLFDDAGMTPQELTLCGCGRFTDVNQVMFGIHGYKSSRFYYVAYNYTNRSIDLRHRALNASSYLGFSEPEIVPRVVSTVRVTDPPVATYEMTGFDNAPFIDTSSLWGSKYDTTLIRLSVIDYMQTLDSPDFVMAAAMSINREKITLAIKPINRTHTLPGLTKVISGHVILENSRGPRNPKLMLASMNKGDPLHSVVVYKCAMSEEKLTFVLDQQEYPIFRTMSDTYDF